MILNTKAPWPGSRVHDPSSRASVWASLLSRPWRGPSPWRPRQEGVRKPEPPPPISKLRAAGALNGTCPNRGPHPENQNGLPNPRSTQVGKEEHSGCPLAGHSQRPWVGAPPACCDWALQRGAGPSVSNVALGVDCATLILCA